LPATDLPLLIDAARIAGRIACSYAGPATQRWDKPDGAGPVTEADLAVNDMLSSVLRAARPGYGWLSEETDDSAARLDGDTVFIIDPIDGTRSFVEGSKTWAHSIAVAQARRITAAVVYLPALGKLYAAASGQGATLNDAPLRVSGTDQMQGCSVLATKPALQPHHWRAGVPPALKRGHRPSLAYRLALVAEGRFDGMLTLRDSWEWDIAAGALIVTEAGGVISDRTGLPLQFNNPHPTLNGIIAATPAVHAGLHAALLPPP
jgi:myo-inositol-1(or 4)-monophosphatase